MRCSVNECPGEYEGKTITQVFSREGRVIVVEDIPALVCNICGDTLLSAEVVEQLFRIDAPGGRPVKFAPVFKYKVGATP